LRDVARHIDAAKAGAGSPYSTHLQKQLGIQQADTTLSVPDNYDPLADFRTPRRPSPSPFPA